MPLFRRKKEYELDGAAMFFKEEERTLRRLVNEAGLEPESWKSFGDWILEDHQRFLQYHRKDDVNARGEKVGFTAEGYKLGLLNAFMAEYVDGDTR